MLSRKELEAQEAKILAPYATLACNSLGRDYPESEHPYRTCFQRDHDRIIHSTAFRRLEYKTQVFVIHEGDYYRTRLTHSLEVAQISETVARALKLNADLVKVIALAHDVGHGPFGHSGEDALRTLMRRHGGFDHNLQALRVVELLEERYADFPGLNLTREVRDALNKHRVALGQGGPKRLFRNLSLEAQVVNLCDEIAYDHHDLDDGLTSGLIQEEQLQKLEVWDKPARSVSKTYSKLRPEVRRYQIIRRLMDERITDLIQASEQKILDHKIRHSDDARRLLEPMIRSSEPMRRLRAPLKEFLNKQLYHHYKVVRMADRAKRILTSLFEVYLHKPEQLPNTTRSRLAKGQIPRVICDYLAGMTDRYAMEEYRKLFLPLEPI